MFDFEKPKIEIAEISEDKKYGRFVVEPLERSFPTTITPPSPYCLRTGNTSVQYRKAIFFGLSRTKETGITRTQKKRQYPWFPVGEPWNPFASMRTGTTFFILQSIRTLFRFLMKTESSWVSLPGRASFSILRKTIKI